MCLYNKVRRGVLHKNIILNEGFRQVKICKISITVANILIISPLFELALLSISPFGNRSPKAML